MISSILLAFPGRQEMLLVRILSILIIVFLWIYPIIDILKSKFRGSYKIVWFLVVFFLFIFGGILYLLIGRKQKIK